MHFCFVVASFSVPVRATVAEGDALTLCAQMNAIPARSILGHDVVVTLSTLNGKGMYGY